MQQLGAHETLAEELGSDLNQHSSLQWSVCSSYRASGALFWLYRYQHTFSLYTIVQVKYSSTSNKIQQNF